MQKITLGQKILLILLGITLCVSLLEIGLRASGFILLFLQEQKNKHAIQQKETYRILCIGESVTFGLSARGKDSYPAQLEETLNARKTGIMFSVINKGMPAAKTSFIVSELADNINKYKPDMIIAMMGINDKQSFVPFDIVCARKKVFSFRSFRVYNLAKLLRLRILNKFEIEGIYKPKQDLLPKSNMLEEKDTLTDINPKGLNTYIQLATSYQQQGKYIQAEGIFRKAIEIDPKNYYAYSKLGWCYFAEKKYAQAEDIFKKTMGINTANACLDLGCFYYYQHEYVRAEQMLKKAIEIYPKSYRAYATLTECYSEEGKHKEAMEVCKKAIEIEPRLDWAYGSMALLYKKSGQGDLAEQYFRKANSLRSEYYDPVTRQNYQRLKEIATQRRIRLVCAQYPMRNIEPLKKMFDYTEGIIFVDNEGVFREALKTSGYEEYFSDMLGGDFGHCTKKGNKLLAANIADIILKECFGK